MPISDQFKEKKRYLAKMRAFQHWHILRGISLPGINNYLGVQKTKGTFCFDHTLD